MGERPTKDRLDEIRARLEIGRLPVLGTALDVVDELLAEIDALTSERDELNTLRENAVKSYCRALDRADRAEAGLSMSETLRRSDMSDLAETRAQLARLREAVVADEAAEHDFRQWSEAYEAGDASFEAGEAVRARAGVTRTALASALSEPGPTLASIRAEAQVEVLREMADAARSDLDYADDGASAAYWLRQRADEIEASRG